ncbi:hypothetical protein [Williamwhitmania taraxaci]|uniref:Uncharacterized protein n=1 Tax=Williamwhitmania taraxaci TaxID=1640674 RepID=A0A1G6NNM5_9BACT|nr:hypothetical protein [Williamwhitmania taraxaci]SDC68974.1 hypothetical protein SAMN05216323_104425 [Williamwhitmania taraxaci]
MKFSFIVLVLITGISALQFKAPIYYAKKTYTFNVEIKKKGESCVNNKVYLTTFNEYWPFDNEQKWIGWTEQFNHISVKETGVGESSERIFLHPPRKDKYAILEFSPYPIVHFPLSVGKVWNWNLEIGQFWAKQAGIKNFGEVYNFKYAYKVTKDTSILFDKSFVKCFVIEANCKSPYGNSRLISYFNEKYGFIKMRYLNMDGSRFHFTLEKVQDFKEAKANDKLPVFLKL